MLGADDGPVLVGRGGLPAGFLKGQLLLFLGRLLGVDVAQEALAIIPLPCGCGAPEGCDGDEGADKALLAALGIRVGDGAHAAVVLVSGDNVPGGGGDGRGVGSSSSRA